MSSTMQQTEDQVLSLPDFSALAPEDQGSPLPPKPPWWRRRGGIISIILIILLILAGFLAFFLIRGRQRPVTYETQQVTQSNFSLTVSATGPVQSAVYNVVFSGSGILSEIDVAVGQSVMKGQVLARLNKTSLQDALNAQQATVLSAQTGVDNANANLSKAEAAALASMQSGQTTLNNAQASLAKTQTQSQASINLAQTTLNNDQTNLTNTQAESAASIASSQTALSNAQTTLSKTQAQSSASVSAAQTALSNAQTDLSKTQTTANAQIAQAQLAKDQACSATSTPTPTPTASSCATATAAYNTAVAQANASVATAQGNVSTARKALTSAQAQASANNATAQNGVNTAQKDLSSAQAASTSNNATAQAKISSDQQSLASTTAQANSSNTTAQNAVNTATSGLATAQTSSDSSVTTLQGTANSAQSTLQSALVGLQTAQHNLANATLTAPHAGIVTAVNGNVGGTPGPSSSSSTTSSTGTSSGGGGGTFIQISDTSTLQVQAAVNESDTANLKVGEPAQFTVSAYGARIFTGTISAISPFGQTVSNVVTFPVTIDVNKDDLQNANLLPGMTASATIVVIQRPNVVLVPVNAINFARTATTTFNGIPPLITTDQARSALEQARQQRTDLINQNPSVAQDNPIPAYVIEQPGGQKSFIAVPVVLGLTDDTYYVVLQGLSPGDLIIAGAQRG